MDSRNKTYQRALDKRELIKHAVHPATSQRYLTQWSAWWHHLDVLSPLNNLTGLLTHAQDVGAADAALEIASVLASNEDCWDAPVSQLG